MTLRNIFIMKYMDSSDDNSDDIIDELSQEVKKQTL